MKKARNTEHSDKIIPLFLAFVSFLIIGVILTNQNQITKKDPSSAAGTVLNTYLRQTVYNEAGTQEWTRDCPVNQYQGPDFLKCTSWSSPIDITSRRGIGGESYSAIGAFVFSKNGVQTLRQTAFNAGRINFNSVIFDIGQASFKRDCDISTGFIESKCEPTWSGPSDNRSLRGGVNESYRGYTAFVLNKNNIPYLRQSFIDGNGQNAYSRDCVMVASGPEFNQCTWNPSTVLTNEVPQAVGSNFYSVSGTIYSANDQQWFRQVLVDTGLKSFLRVCKVNNISGIDFSDCPGGFVTNPLPWLPTITGSINYSWGGYEEFIYTRVEPATPPPTPTPSPTPTIIPIPGIPTSISASCNTNGTSAVIEWPEVAGATAYSLRISNSEYQFTCPITDRNPYDRCHDTISIAYGLSPVKPNSQYSMWVHAKNSSGISTARIGSFKCVAPTPTPSPTRSPSPTPSPTPVPYGCNNVLFLSADLIYPYTRDCFAVPKQMYVKEPRFTIFHIPQKFGNFPYIKTDNVGIKEDRNLRWTVTSKVSGNILIMYRKIPDQVAPKWLTQNYQKLTNDDYSNLQQFVLRKNEQGLIGVYDVYSRIIKADVPELLGPASDETVTAFSMYIVGVSPGL
ncbi:MAG: hypothetical protein M3Q44_06385 [bacterium]|nr:hypothetical protein [bacterium]